MSTPNIRFEDIIIECKKNHKITNKGLVKNVYDFIISKLENPDSHKEKGSCSSHALCVAYFIAQLGFEADTLCAALLYTTLKNTHATHSEIEASFGNNIADIVDAVTAIDTKITSNMEEFQKETFQISGEYLKNKIIEKALFIKVAHIIDVLRTATASLTEDEKMNCAKYTREIIIPLLKKEEAYQLIDTLENLCLQIEHPERYTEINNAYTALRNSNKHAITNTLHLFSEVFSPSSSADSGEHRTALGSIVDFTYNPRAIISIYRQINAHANNFSRDWSTLLCKKNIALYDLTLVISDDYCLKSSQNLQGDTSPTHVFFKLYSNFLADKNITIVDFGSTTYKDSRYYILSDEMDNRYRLFVKSETEYMRYKLGHIIDTEDIIDFTSVVDGKKIKVYRKDGSAMYIEAGATFLDFAFAIHSEIGLHFDYALTDGNKAKRKYYERINEGDIITIETKPSIEPNLHWFKYVKTNRSMDYLIRYFSKK